MMGEAPPPSISSTGTATAPTCPPGWPSNTCAASARTTASPRGNSRSSASRSALPTSGPPLRHRLRDRPHRPLGGSFNGVKQMGSADKTFILSESGHIAGIINPPSKDKYGHYTKDGGRGHARGLAEAATFHKGSWWPRWGAWLARRSGPQVPARQPGDGPHPVLCPAPGTYVVAEPGSTDRPSPSAHRTAPAARQPRLPPPSVGEGWGGGAPAKGERGRPFRHRQPPPQGRLPCPVNAATAAENA